MTAPTPDAQAFPPLATPGPPEWWTGGTCDTCGDYRHVFHLCDNCQRPMDPTARPTWYDPDRLLCQDCLDWYAS